MGLGFFGWCFVLLDAAAQAVAMQQRIMPLLLLAALGPALLVPFGRSTP